MSAKIDAAKKRAEKAKARALEAERKRQAADKMLAEIERSADTRRKIIDGAHIQVEALNNPEIAALLNRLRDEKLILDHERSLFGLALLGEEEKDRRMAKRNASRRRKGSQGASESAGSDKEMEAA